MCELPNSQNIAQAMFTPKGLQSVFLSGRGYESPLYGFTHAYLCCQAPDLARVTISNQIGGRGIYTYENQSKIIKPHRFVVYTILVFVHVSRFAASNSKTLSFSDVSGSDPPMRI